METGVLVSLFPVRRGLRPGACRDVIGMENGIPGERSAASGTAWRTPRRYGHDERDPGVRRLRSTEEGGEQSRGASQSCGVTGGKAVGQEKSARAKHGPDTGPGNGGTCAGAVTQSCPTEQKSVGTLMRHLIKAGARCGSSARRDLYGGCPARGIPTVLAINCLTKRHSR